MKDANGPIFFTICSKNLLGYAKTCLESVRKHHPESDLYIFLADRFLGPKTGFDESGIEVVTLEEHGGWTYRDMMFRYNITEFNTSIKPFCFLHLFEQYENGSDVVYLDPDTWLISPLTEVVDAFDGGANAVLIPHMTEPLGFGNLPDRTLLRYGAYNFGFVALKNNPHNQEIVCWWADELRDHCVIDYENGLFVDQKYGDLFPSFIPDTHILRHNGYNVAYWNLISRTFSKDENNNVLVNGEPLRFVHFSGASLKNDTDMISRHCTTLKKKHRSIYGDLLDQWSEQLKANQHLIHLEQGYSFFWNNVDKENEHTPEEKKDKNQVVSFERNQWLFMLQFTDMETYDSWSDRESQAIESVGKASANHASHKFCNSCFSWSVADDWTADACAACHSAGSARLLNAFLYQELKLRKDALVGVAGPDAFGLAGLSDRYNKNVVELDLSLENRHETAESVDYLVLANSYDGVTESIDKLVVNAQWPTLIVSVENDPLRKHKDGLAELMRRLNDQSHVRASMFVGLSANHALDGQTHALLFIENLRNSNLYSKGSNSERSGMSAEPGKFENSGVVANYNSKVA